MSSPVGAFLTDVVFAGWPVTSRSAHYHAGATMFHNSTDSERRTMPLTHRDFSRFVVRLAAIFSAFSYGFFHLDCY